MLERGLQPDFSTAAKRETDRITRAATDSSARDLRGPLPAVGGVRLILAALRGPAGPEAGPPRVVRRVPLARLLG